jgi:hypothetical protein
MSRPTVGPIQPRGPFPRIIKWRQAVKLFAHVHPAPRLKMSDALPPQPHTPYDVHNGNSIRIPFIAAYNTGVAQGCDAGRILYDNVFISVILTYY